MGFDDAFRTGSKIAQTAQQVVQAGMDIAQAVAGALEGPRLETVQYNFRDINGPGAVWRVRRVRLAESLSEPYELVLDLLTEELEVETDELLGADVEFEVVRSELVRTVYGVVHRVDYIGVTADKLLVRIYAVPALRLLTGQVNTRIFQDRTVLEIVEEVLSPGLELYGRTYSSDRLADVDQYPKRDYCVQYNESDFAFVSRLLEEEGIAYFFEPDQDELKEVLQLINDNNNYPDVPVLLDAPVPIIPDRPETADRESLREFQWCKPEQVNKVVAWHHNWKVADSQLWPGTSLEATQEQSEPERGRVRELYIHGDHRKIVDREGEPNYNGSADDELTPRATRRLQLSLSQAQRGQGRSNVSGFACGGKFELLNHSRPDLEGVKYLLTRVVHTGDCPEEERAEGGGSNEERYENRFECIPEDIVFRPPLLTRRPRVHGPTTAIVTGPGGEEIHTDAFGRVKVKFPWDRLNPTDDTSSCWVRVAQSWAGPGWGAMFIPRIGMEVVVEFLEGNPDRPLITGCVYNAFTSTPFPLPDDKTKTTLKTQSSPNKQGYNELTFEDLAGGEQIIIHAQKDFNEKVENNHMTLVGANQTNSVEGNQSESITGDQSLTVSGKRTKTVTKNEDNIVDGARTTKIKCDETLKVTGHTAETYVAGLEQKVTSDYKLEVAALYAVTVKGQQKVEVIGTSELTVSDTHTAVATNAYFAAQGKTASMELKASKANFWGQAEFALGAGKGGESSIVGQSSGKLGISATSELKLACGSASIVLTSDGKISITGPTKVEIQGGTGGVKLDAAGAAVSGPSVKSAADGINEITGAMVKIN